MKDKETMTAKENFVSAVDTSTIESDTPATLSKSAFEHWKSIFPRATHRDSQDVILKYRSNTRKACLYYLPTDVHMYLITGTEVNDKHYELSI